MDDIGARLLVLEDLRAIETLKARYAAALDGGYDVDALCALFVPHGRWTADGFADLSGHDEIRAFFAKMPETVVEAYHFITAPRITLAPDGCSATGQFHLLCHSRSRKAPGEPLERFVTLGRYDDRFVKVAGHWLIEDMTVVVTSVFRTQSFVPPGKAGLS